MAHDYELKPQRVQLARELNLEATAFRCGGWSVRGPSGWRTWRTTERASAVLGLALFAGLGLVGVMVPVVLVAGLLRLVGVLP